MHAEPIIEAFFDEATNTISYLVADPATGMAVVIDPVLDFDMASGEADVRSAQRILDRAKESGWQILAVLETHAHADHLSAAPFIKAQTGAWVGIGEHIRDVQRIFRPVFALDDLVPDGRDFDRLFRDDETFEIGDLTVEVLHVPGHTPADLAYRIGGSVFVGDTLFIVRRRNIWRRFGVAVTESGPRQGLDFRRRACGVASGDVRWSAS